MGRSKFPGKPSKHILRKRINVLPPSIEVTNVESNSSMTVESVVENKQDEDVTENSESAVIQNVNKKFSIKRRLNRKIKSSLVNPSSSQSLLSRLCSKTVKGKINKGTRTTLTRKAVHNYAAACRAKSTKEATNLVGKFVLPTRSVHSSRVIKPNKRFLSDLSESVTLKKTVNIAKRQCMKQEERSKLKVKHMESGSFNDETDKTTFTNGHKVVLRQARLKLPNQIGTQGPFTRPNNSSSGTVTCGVCGAIRFYRFVKQARKFNIYSCESCRKFIAKMIKRLACGNQNNQTILVCNKGQGSCHISPIIKSQQWKLTKCPYRSRCPACWLKMCLRSFQMPASLKQSLSLMLPKNMQSMDVSFSSALPPLLWQANVEAKMLEKSIEKPQEATIVKQRPVRFKNPKTQTVASLPVSNTDIKRQKIDVKGPRVKHVCRSASIVLGQPIATFVDKDKKCDTQNQSVTYLKSADDKVVSDKKTLEGKCTVYSKSDSPYSESESGCSDKLFKVPLLNDPIESSTKKDRSTKNISASQTCSEMRISEVQQNLENDTQNGISIDFWEGYDADNIRLNGYCLIGSEQFSMTAVCFLCGSAGKEPMMYCSLCCEPYHTFCLDVVVPSSTNMKQTWVCPKCVNCHECSQNYGHKISCLRCLKAYHPVCINLKLNNHEKLMFCSKCSKCKNCSSLIITNFVGNFPLCITCFKLRRKGNFCPLCQHSYENDETAVKLIECTKCIKWVHAECEKLSEEQFYILCHLPNSVKYTCSSCCNDSGPYWKRLLYTELKACLNKVLRLLSRNKLARNCFKSVSSKTTCSIRKLQFSDDLDIDNNNYNKDITDINKIYSFEENEKYESICTKSANTLTVMDIRNKLFCNNYSSVKKFHEDLIDYLKSLKSEQVLKVYESIFEDIFPWYKSLSNEEIKQMEPIPIEESHYNYPIEQDPKFEVSPVSADKRICEFCKTVGDGPPTEESRLLYCGQNEWVHANCAYWSSDVVEDIDGSLRNVQTALMKSQLVRCCYCKQKGASVACHQKGCHETYHFGCGRIVKLNFIYDKTVYCSSHDVSKRNHIIVDERGFLIHRPVFIELENKRTISAEIDKVNYMVGSLTVTNLGKIEPLASDQIDIIVPIGFVCTRLFWSTVEPWRLVPYTIVTSLQNSNRNTLIVDRNFTIDHTLAKNAVDKIIREFNAWQRDIDKKTSDIESEDDEEQQNGTELLSPELTDAILEELPHDLLDGISVQDIFPKFSYEDLVSIDCKNEISNIENITENYRKTEIEEDLDNDFKTKELKRNKSDNFTCSKIDALQKPKTSQKTCSLAINCKIDSSLSPVIKKRKIAAARENSMIYQLLQVDGNVDDSSSECGSPIGQSQSDTWNHYVSEEPVTCEKCQCTYRTQASYKRHLDACEVLCTSESDSEIMPDQEIVTAYVSPTNDIIEGEITEPVVISSYESYQSEIHTSVLNTHSFVASSKATELLAAPQNPEIVIQQPLAQPLDQKPIIPSLPVNTVANITVDTSSADQTFRINQPTITINGDSSMSIPTNHPQFCVNQTVPLCVSQPLTMQAENIQVNPSTYSGNQLLSIGPNGSISINPINQTNSIGVNQLGQQTVQQPMDFHQTHSVTIQSLPLNNTILNVGGQNISLNGKLIANPMIQTVNVPGTHWVKQINKPTILAQKALKPKARSRTIAAKRPTQFEEGDTIILPAQNSTGQIIVQPIPSTNYVPAFVDTFQPSGQNVQYVATITPQAVPAQPLVQIQPENNIISIVPGLQQTMYIQQPRVLENQLVMDSNGAIGWSQQQTVQPVYYGFETIVQNTVMQSQQFLPTTMPGVLTANSSYSTTTQVFQTSKLEPVLDVSSNSFVLVNSGPPMVNSQSVVNPQSLVNSQQIINSQPLVSTQPIVNPQPIVSSQPMINTQPIISSQTIVNPQPVINSQAMLNSQPIMNAQSTNNAQPQYEIRQYSQPQPMNLVNNTLISQVDVKPSHIHLNLSRPQQHIEVKPAQPLMNIKPVQPKIEVKLAQPKIEIPRPPQIEINPVQLEVKPVQQLMEVKPSHIEVKPSQASNLKCASQKPITSVSGNSITLPTSPFVSEQRIPTNIVTPIPKPTTTSRPMSRVLPMPTTNILKESKKIISDDEKVFIVDKPKKIISEIRNEDVKPPSVKQQFFSNNSIIKVETKKVDIVEIKNEPVLAPPIKSLKPIKEVTKEEVFNLFEPPPKLQKVTVMNVNKLPPPKEQIVQKSNEINVLEDTKVDTPLKLVFQKQAEDGTYKISNNFTVKQPIQVAPLKPIKSITYSQNSHNLLSNTTSQPSVTTRKDKEQKSEEKIEKEKPNSENLKTQSKKENDSLSSILYTIETQDGFKYSSSSVTDLWSKVIEAVQAARAAHNMPPLPINNNVKNSMHLLGLKSNGLKYLLEQLPGATKCSKYKSMFNFPPHPSEMYGMLPQDHLYGAIRCAPFENKRTEPYDMFGWLSSKHRQPEEISLDTLELLPRRVVNLPMAMKFRQLKLTSKYSVGVYRSRIHGRGLFCLRDIEAGEMVIEYAGEVIRSILTDKREKYYNSKSIGCYMFRVDDNFVVDATMKGNAARFINHSCDPNCYSRVVEILGHKHIIIFALRRILSGEELTYDYKFPFEEDKIPCTCGSRKCRKFLN